MFSIWHCQPLLFPSICTVAAAICAMANVQWICGAVGKELAKIGCREWMMSIGPLVELGQKLVGNKLLLLQSMGQHGNCAKMMIVAVVVVHLCERANVLKKLFKIN